MLPKVKHQSPCRLRLQKWHLLLLAVAQLLLTVANDDCLAQSFKLMRYQEEYHILKDSSKTFYNSLKYISLSASKGHYLSLGGEVRPELGVKIDEDWVEGQGFNYSVLQRHSIYADARFGSRFRVFGQLNSALESGNRYGPAPVDEDQLNVQNLFGEYKVIEGKGWNLALRVGRQEINYGSGRLISVRDGTTTRQYFTGSMLMYRAPGLTIDGFAFSVDEVNRGIFDNRNTKSANLWGAYSSFNLRRALHLDLYYLGIRQKDASFEEGVGRETRHTLATRFWKENGSLVYNLETAYQFGCFDMGRINAWTLAVEMGYTFYGLKFKPTVTLRNDYISGDGDAGDGHLQTFNTLYPRGGYFGFNPLIGPSNLIDIHPSLALMMTNRLSLQADLVFNWRYSLSDGLYRPSGNFNVAGSMSKRHFIGTTYLFSADYSFSRFLTISYGFQYFAVGAFIRDIISRPADSRYMNVQVLFKF